MSIYENTFLVGVDEATGNNRLQQELRRSPSVSTASVTHLEAAEESEDPPLLVFSHLRWNFVTQRPQHLLTRAAQSRHVYFWEEPWLHEAGNSASFVGDGGFLEVIEAEQTAFVTVLRPHLKIGEDLDQAQRILLDRFVLEYNLQRHDSWYYTPMALQFTAHLRPRVTVYDCMDELSAFLGAPAVLVERETELFKLADVVFTGGRSIYEAKRTKHPSVHAFPSSIDRSHFAQAQMPQLEPCDQKGIPTPRVGFFGVLDERLDLTLVSELARLRPHLQFVFLGPIVKIDPTQLPTASNIHYLGNKSYGELPSYLAGWDAAILPFAMNDSTRFISPTKTPEYLAAGKRVVSTPIRDVITDYGDLGLVEIAGAPHDFANALDRATSVTDDGVWTQNVNRKLTQSSWDLTWAAMRAQIDAIANRKRTIARTVFSSPYADKLNPPSSASIDYLVVGAGFAGSVVAERLASQLGKRILIVDKRPHIGGNTYDFYNDDGLLVHLYGPHIFHTSSQKVVDYLSCFTEWRPYEHRVLAKVDGKLLPIPINLDTINGLYGLNLDSRGMEGFLAERAELRSHIRTSEDVVVSRVGRELYEKFFRNYTRKQWGLDPSELDSCVAGRIPVRFNKDDRYFSDSFQAMPLHGFTRLFEKMLADPKIEVSLSTDYRDVVASHPSAKVIYTGPIDEFFDYRFGKLPYRSLRFEHQTHDTEQYQPVAVVNYPNEESYTRITEFKHLTGQSHRKTSVVFEYPTDDGEPYYPIPRPENTLLYERYSELASATEGVYFCGRLANYRYFNMDQVVAQALHLYRNIADDEANEGSGEIPVTMLSSQPSRAQAAT